MHLRHRTSLLSTWKNLALVSAIKAFNVIEQFQNYEICISIFFDNIWHYRPQCFGGGSVLQGIGCSLKLGLVINAFILLAQSYLFLFFLFFFFFFKCEYEDLYVGFPIRIKVGVFSRKKKNLNFCTSNFGSNLTLRICV